MITEPIIVTAENFQKMAEAADVAWREYQQAKAASDQASDRWISLYVPVEEFKKREAVRKEIMAELKGEKQ